MLEVAEEVPSLESSRRVATRLAHVRVLLSTNRVAPSHVPLVARCLLGLLRVRFALFWPPACDCLAGEPLLQRGLPGLPAG
jgi:hypothetical protein